MDLSQIPLFAMLRGRLGYLSERQRVIAENVANSDTPGFRPSDLKPFSFDVKMQEQSGSATAVTQPGHMPLKHGGTSVSSQFMESKGRDSETTLNGNAVSLEEQMLKLSDARMNYDAAISFYQKSLGLLRTAARAPGR
jgi:flagellar basal-body rod protein FlgB